MPDPSRTSTPPQSVELKVNVTSDVVAAIAALGLADPDTWRVVFCEEVTHGVGVTTPLLDRGVVLRARDKGDGDGDSTVKLRPCRRSQLSAEFSRDDGAKDTGHDGAAPWELKVEADWAGTSRSLAASLSVDGGSAVLDAVLAGTRPAADLFDARQRRFLADCAEARVTLDAVSALPPITATRWKKVGALPGLKARAERWTLPAVAEPGLALPPVDLLELSIVRPPAEAPAAMAAFVDAVRAAGVRPAQDDPLPDDPAARPRTKTQQVLERLVAEALGR